MSEFCGKHCEPWPDRDHHCIFCHEDRSDPAVESSGRWTAAPRWREPEPEPLWAYCVKCKDKRAMVDPTIEVSPSRRRVVTARCEVCGAILHRILGPVEVYP